MNLYRKSRVPDYAAFMHWLLILLACGGARIASYGAAIGEEEWEP